MTERVIYTIGHSSQSCEDFVRTLKQHSIDVVADVRSRPYSKFAPQFNRGDLMERLKESGIKYGFFGDALGARVDDASCYSDGRVQYDRLANRSEFKQAISRLRQGAQDYRIALMCSEKEPLECHRAILVSQELAKAGCAVQHIHMDGSIESHEDLLERLLGVVKLPKDDLLHSKDELISAALVKQESEIAHRDEDMA